MDHGWTSLTRRRPLIPFQTLRARAELFGRTDGVQLAIILSSPLPPTKRPTMQPTALARLTCLACVTSSTSSFLPSPFLSYLTSPKTTTKFSADCIAERAGERGSGPTRGISATGVTLAACDATFALHCRGIPSLPSLRFTYLSNERAGARAE